MISQSGAITEEVIAAGNARGLPISTIVSVGNAAHLEVADYLAYLGEQEACTCVLLYIESIADPARFAEIARSVAAKKPVVAMVGGRTGQGGSAVRNHTGGLAMPDAEAATFFSSCGVIRVKSLRHLLLAAKGFGFTRTASANGFCCFPIPVGRRYHHRPVDRGRVGDAAAAQRLCRRSGTLMPPEAAVANPIDMLADAREDRFGPAFSRRCAMGSDQFDAILMIHVVPFMVDAGPIIDELARLAKDAPCRSCTP